MKTQSLPLSAITAQLRFLQGSVLTIVDASYASPEQNKAIKDLIKQSFSEKMRWITTLCNGQDNGGDLLYCDRIAGEL
jgi:hypothetical protein